MSQWFYPCMPWERYYISATVLSDQYYRLFDAEHTGIDINGVLGGNTDWHSPVYAIGDGIVVESKFYSVWGNIILIYHPSADIYSQYAHLDARWVSKGDKVKGGQRLGGIGRGAGNAYIAHLHFEIRYGFGGDKSKTVPADYWPSAEFANRWDARNAVKQYYVLDPIAVLKKFKANWRLPRTR